MSHPSHPQPPAAAAPLGVDRARDARITALAARTSQRCDAAVSFLRRALALLAMIAGGLWAVLTWLEPCAAGTLCMGVVGMPRRGRPAYSSTSPAALEIPQPPLSPPMRAWTRWRLWLAQMRLLSLDSDLLMLREGIAQDEALIDAVLARRIAVREELIDLQMALLRRGVRP